MKMALSNFLKEKIPPKDKGLGPSLYLVSHLLGGESCTFR